MSSELNVAAKLPLKISLELSGTDGDVESYELTVEVPGSNQSVTVATIKREEGEGLRIDHVDQSSLDALDKSLRDRLLIRLFKLAYGAMVESDGSAIEWWLSDITRFLRRGFEPDDVAVLSAALASFVDPAVTVADMSIVSID